MEVQAVAKFVRVQPRKVRILADQVSGRTASNAAALLRYHPSKGARALRKVLLSAVANARENSGLNEGDLKIARIMVDEGPKYKRIQARAMGRANRILKKTSHITVVVEDVEALPVVKPHGTKAKPRPTFAAPSKGKGKKSEAKEAAAPAAAAAEAVDETVEPTAPAEEPAPAVEPAAEPTPEPQEATPVTESDAPESEGSASSHDAQEETTPQAEGATTEQEETK